MATRIVLTYADLVAMPADGKRYELHEGEIYMTAAPGLGTSKWSATCI